MISEVRIIEVRNHESVCDHHNAFALYMEVYKMKMIDGMRASRCYISSITKCTLKPDDTMTALIPYRNKCGIVEGKWLMKKWKQCI